MKHKVLTMFVFTVRSSIEVDEHSPVVQNRRGNKDSSQRTLILSSQATCRNRVHIVFTSDGNPVCEPYPRRAAPPARNRRAAIIRDHGRLRSPKTHLELVDPGYEA